MFLTILTFLPLVLALVLLFLPDDRNQKRLTLGFSLLVFAVSLFILPNFDKSSAELQLVEQYPWIKSVGISYFMAIDGISLWLVLLTTFLTPIALLSAWTSIEEKEKAFCISLLALETTMLGTFLSMDLVLFYVFFEASLIPMYFMIGIWGGKRRIYATLKFFIYTMAGSLFMLIGIISLMFLSAGQFDGQMTASIPDLYNVEIPFIKDQMFNTHTLLFLAFCLAFAIKCPLFPVHTWLPDAHVEAPTPGSIILAGVLLKMGTYGFMRLVIPMFPEAMENLGWVFLFIGTFGIIYGALVAMVQPDIKKLVAYSSVSHMGYVVIGLFAWNNLGMTGGLYQMLNHGVSTGALFLLVGMLYERTHSRDIKDYSGLAAAAPIFSIIFLIVTMSSIAVPMTNGFVGEFLILLGTFQAQPWYGAVAVVGVVLGATYMLWMIKKVFYGEIGGLVTKYGSKLEITTRELLTAAPLVIMIFWMGLFPNHFINWSKASLENLSNNRFNYELKKGN
jgi:NADH-quinone oxidoreductase subunit M